MTQKDPSVDDLAALIKCINAAKGSLASTQTMLKDLHDRLREDGDGVAAEMIDAAEQATEAAGEFSDSFTETAGQMAAALSALETAAQDTAGAAGLPAGDALMDAGGAAFSAACSAAARAITEQGDALGERGFAHALPLLEAAAEGCQTAGELALAKMKTLHKAADEVLPGLMVLHMRLANKSHDAADEAAHQADAIPNVTQTAVAAIRKACSEAIAGIATLRGDLEKVFDQRQGEIDKQATRLEDAISKLLQARNQEAQGATTALLTPVQSAIAAALGGSGDELANWEGSAGAVAEAAEGLQELAGELAIACRVMGVSNETLEEMGKG